MHTDRQQTSHGAAARWLPTTDLQQRGFAVHFEDAFRGETRKVFSFCSLKLPKKSYRNIE